MKKSNKPIKVRIPFNIRREVLQDLERPHEHAHERVGFLFSREIELENCVLILITQYAPVSDDNYVKDGSVGAHINTMAIHESMQKVLTDNMGCFHVHLHSHTGTPSPSTTDKRGLPPVVGAFSNVNSEQTHGIIILSKDSIYVSCKVKGRKQFITPDLISIVGYPMQFVYRPEKTSASEMAMFDRQSFLGPNAQSHFRKIRVGIIGYGGGGSHIGQQIAHLGVENVTVFDEDIIEETNLNRLIGGWFADVKHKLLKISIAKRTIKKILPSASVTCVDKQWQIHSSKLHECDVVIGCVDSLLGRQQLEAECRRFFIPYIDIGMDVFNFEGKPHMSGQVILSMPGMACMFCLGYLHEGVLAAEAAKYGATGGRPQVVWANGILASNAVGIFVDLVTGWTGQKDKLIYQAYDENRGLLGPDNRVEYIQACSCDHYKTEDAGPPKFLKL